MVNSNENPLLSMLRPIVLNMMSKSNDENILREAPQRFQSQLKGDFIDSNLRNVVYALVSRYENEQIQEQLKHRYQTTDMTEEKIRILRAMSQSIDLESIQKTFEFIFEDDNVRMQNSTAGLMGCASSRIDRDLVWRY